MAQALTVALNRVASAQPRNPLLAISEILQSNLDLDSPDHHPLSLDLDSPAHHPLSQEVCAAVSRDKNLDYVREHQLEEILTLAVNLAINKSHDPMASLAGHLKALAIELAQQQSMEAEPLYVSGVSALRAQLVLVPGLNDPAKERFCEQLASRTGGSVLSMQQLVLAESLAESEEGRELAEVFQRGKIVPSQLHLRLLLRAMKRLPPPHLLLDYPPASSQLPILEGAAGPVRCVLRLSGVPLDKMSEAIVRELEPRGCVHTITVLEGASGDDASGLPAAVGLLKHLQS